MYTEITRNKHFLIQRSFFNFLILEKDKVKGKVSREFQPLLVCPMERLLGLSLPGAYFRHLFLFL